MTIISDYVLTSSFLCQALHAFPKKTGAYILTFCVRLIYALFVNFVLLFLFIVKRKQKLISFLMEKRMAVELFEQFLSPFVQNRSVIFEITYQLYDYFKGQFIKLYHLYTVPASMFMLSVLILTVYCNKGIQNCEKHKTVMYCPW